jgi:hypothetical protein
MRQLTKKQKKILDNYRNISRLEDLPDGVFERLEKINDTEILWSETNRYLGDNYLRELYVKNDNGVIKPYFMKINTGND